nr:immunoglobulin heavy chain junction region [Macaca mulatta]MOW75293.1 immunoglobulin heavy chain junction region [Macaca mulatta]MOW76356.1 immunoglobulin heavy chain junction region [Macaca mulatta]MOW79757.1 immunoglobulin heavy chain junction region [Macaca mulatta]MOW79857.1 immunoglobulin heavy chain junction region [Macaca mulatta]
CASGVGGKRILGGYW